MINHFEISTSVVPGRGWKAKGGGFRTPCSIQIHESGTSRDCHAGRGIESGMERDGGARFKNHPAAAEGNLIKQLFFL